MHPPFTKPVAILVAALMALAVPAAGRAQSTVDRQQVTLARIQSDERAIMFDSMDLDDAQVEAFAPLYDAYQGEYKEIMDRAIALIDEFAANYESMTDDAAAKLLKDWFRLKDDEDRLIREYAKKMGKVLPPAKVLRFVQVEHKLSTMLRLAAVQDIPLAK
jgi:hypothetical protein